MPSYTITPRSRTMSDYVSYQGDSDFSTTATTPTDVTGITFTPSLPTIGAGKSAYIAGRFEFTTLDNNYSIGYLECSIDGWITKATQNRDSFSASTQTRDFTFNLVNTDSSSHTPEFRIYHSGGNAGNSVNFVLTNASYPVKIIHSYPFTAVSDLTLISQVSKIYAFSIGPTNLSIETKPVNTTFKVLTLDIGYLMRGFTWNTNSSQVFYDYDGFDIGVA